MIGREEPKVLLVDDESDYLEDFRSLFSEKFCLVTACGGGEALAVLEREPIAVVVSDQRMPGMSGSELLAQVSRRYPQTVRILYTGYSDLDAIIDAINKGEIYRYLSKDASLKEVEIVIRQAIDQYQLKEANRLLLQEVRRLQEVLGRLKELSLAIEKLSKTKAEDPGELRRIIREMEERLSEVT
jgi:DNA-binding NtrC family response regulator